MTAGVLLPAMPLLPLLAAAAVPVIPHLALRLVPWLPLPALVLGLLVPDVRVELTGLVYEPRLGLDSVGRVFLLFTAVIWSLVGLHLQTSGMEPSRPADRRFLFCFLLAMAGNFGVTLAQDPLGFYVLFSVLTFAAYGIIATRPHADARRAGRLYLIVALIGEMAMLAGFMLWASGTTGLTVALLL